MISEEIKEHYGRLFAFFQSRPELADQLLFRRAILQHLPAFISLNAKYRRRVGKLPQKIKFAILAAEIASSIVYRGGWENRSGGTFAGLFAGASKLKSCSE